MYNIIFTIFCVVLFIFGVLFYKGKYRNLLFSRDDLEYIEGKYNIEKILKIYGTLYILLGLIFIMLWIFNYHKLLLYFVPMVLLLKFIFELIFCKKSNRYKKVIIIILWILLISCRFYLYYKSESLDIKYQTAQIIITKNGVDDFEEIEIPSNIYNVYKENVLEKEEIAEKVEFYDKFGKYLGSGKMYKAKIQTKSLTEKDKYDIEEIAELFSFRDIYFYIKK